VNTEESVRINLWSGPRNISTALMYSFAQRDDTTVYDEPLYAHYLSKTTAKEYHPGAEEVIASQENDGSKVVEMIMGKHPTRISFFKHMTHQLIELDLSFLHRVTNVILTRNPYEMIASFSKQIEHPTLRDVGYAAHLKLVKYFQKHQLKFVVLDGKSVLLNPKQMLIELCAQVQIPFDEAMLSWQKGPISEDGVWAKHWYHNVHKSTGFSKYQAKEIIFPVHLKALLDECQPLYDELCKFAIEPNTKN